MVKKRYQLDDEYSDRLNEIQSFLRLDNATETLRNCIDFFLDNNSKKMTLASKTIDENFQLLEARIELIEEKLEELSLKNDLG